MERRAVLSASGLALSSVLAGCLGWSGADEPSVPEGMSVETRHRVADVLAEGRWFEHGHHELVEDETEAGEKLDGDGDVAEFVEETPFEESYVLIVQYVMQSAYSLELREIERTETGLDVAVETASPGGEYDDDATNHALAVRVTDERDGIPDEVNVTVDGEPTET